MRTVQLSTFAYTCSSEMRNSYFCRYFKTLCRWRDQYVNTSGLFWSHCIKGLRDMVLRSSDNCTHSQGECGNT